MIVRKLVSPDGQELMVQHAKSLLQDGFQGDSAKLYNACMKVLPEAERGTPKKGPSEVPAWFEAKLGIPPSPSRLARHTRDKNYKKDRRTKAPPGAVLSAATLAEPIQPAQSVEPAAASSLKPESAPRSAALEPIALEPIAEAIYSLLKQGLQTLLVQALSTPAGQELLRSVTARQAQAQPEPQVQPRPPWPSAAPTMNTLLAPAEAAQPHQESQEAHNGHDGHGGHKNRPVMPKMPATPRKPRVLVIGLLPDQAQMIRKEYSEHFELEFLHQDQTSKRFETLVPHADKVFCMMGFSSHRVTKLVRELSKEHSMVNGGMTDIRRLMTAYQHELASKALHQAFASAEEKQGAA